MKIELILIALLLILIGTNAMAKELLTQKQQNIVMISAYTATGDLENLETSIKKGDVVNIPADIKHWHGAAADSWFSHIAIEVPSQNGSTEWLEKVSDEQYYNLK